MPPSPIRAAKAKANSRPRKARSKVGAVGWDSSRDCFDRLYGPGDDPKIYEWTAETATRLITCPLAHVKKTKKRRKRKKEMWI